MSTETPTAAAIEPQPPAELGLRAVFREPADRFEESAARATEHVDGGEAALAEAPRWRIGATPAWTTLLSPLAVELVRLLVLAVTLGRVRLDDADEGPDAARWTLRRQLVCQRLPTIRREIRAIRRLRRPIARWALTRGLLHLTRLRLALWWSPRAIRFRLALMGLRLQIVAVWTWVNREAIMFYGMILLIVVLLIVLINILQENQGLILDFVDDLIPSRSILGDR